MSNSAQEDQSSSLEGFKIISVIISGAISLLLVISYYTKYPDGNLIPITEILSTKQSTQPRMDSQQGSPYAGAKTSDAFPTQTNLIGERHAVTRMRLLTPNDIQGWNYEKLRYAINEMYARRGADIRDKEIKQVFSAFSWYRPVRNKSYDSVEAEFTYIEKSNLDLLGTYRNACKKMK